jgi:biopolymer transport protein ExbB
MDNQMNRRIRWTALWTLAALSVLGLRSFGQTESAASGTGIDLRYFDFFVVKGGWIAYFIIFLSVVMVALVIEYCLSIRRATIVPLQAAERAKSLIESKQYAEAIAFTADEPSVLGRVLHEALMEAGSGFEAMQRALEESIDERSARLFRKIEALNIIGNVSPMIGLFGTVVGMILLFAEIHAADAFPTAQIVADRVAIALITTFWGLAVAIPALSMYAVFRNRIDVLAAECALTAERLLAVFRPGKVAAPTSPPQREASPRAIHAARS